MKGDALATQRGQLIDELHRTRHELMTARGGEYRDVVVAGTPYTPADAARLVRQGAESGDYWIPAPVEPGAPLPLSADELEELYATSTRLTSQDEAELAQRLPDPSGLPSPAEFKTLAADDVRLANAGQTANAGLWDRAANAAHTAGVRELAREAERATALLADVPDWQIALAAAGLRGDTDTPVWEEFTTKTRMRCARCWNARKHARSHRSKRR